MTPNSHLLLLDCLALLTPAAPAQHVQHGRRRLFAGRGDAAAAAALEAAILYSGLIAARSITSLQIPGFLLGPALSAVLCRAWRLGIEGQSDGGGDRHGSLGKKSPKNPGLSLRPPRW